MAREAEGDGAALSPASANRLHALLRRVVDVQRHEMRAMLVSFAYFFFVLSGWFVLRPIREAVAAATGVSRLPYLFAATLAAVLVANPLFAALVVRFPVRKFITITYQFFVANILILYALMTFLAPVEGSVADLWIGRTFFVWTSVFNLFVVSIFWAFMADSFRSEQAKRLFGLIGGGSSLGGATGAALTAGLVESLGTKTMLLVSAGIMFICLLIVVRIIRTNEKAGQSDAAKTGEEEGVGGGEAIALLRGSRHLQIIALVITFAAKVPKRTLAWGKFPPPQPL